MNWRCLFGRHDTEMLRTLAILGEVRCRRCAKRWLYNSATGGTLPWPKDGDAFFERSLRRRARGSA